jgi:hypothetical protein
LGIAAGPLNQPEQITLQNLPITGFLAVKKYQVYLQMAMTPVGT